GSTRLLAPEAGGLLEQRDRFALVGGDALSRDEHLGRVHHRLGVALLGRGERPAERARAVLPVDLAREAPLRDGVAGLRRPPKERHGLLDVALRAARSLRVGEVELVERARVAALCRRLERLERASLGHRLTTPARRACCRALARPPPTPPRRSRASRRRGSRR